MDRKAIHFAISLKTGSESYTFIRSNIHKNTAIKEFIFVCFVRKEDGASVRKEASN